MSNAEFLKKRSVEFWERAKEDFEKGRYNLTALYVDKHCNCGLNICKYLIF